MAGLDEIGLVLGNLIAECAAEIYVPRILRQPQDCFELSDTKFVKLFRLNKRMADEFITYLEPHMKDQTTALALSAEEKVNIQNNRFLAGVVEW